MSLSTYFDKMTQREYTDITTVEFLRGVRTVWTCKTVEQKFTFIGAPISDAFTTDDVTVTDVNGDRITIAMKPEIKDGSTGTAISITDRTDISRTGFSPHLRNVEVTRRASFYYANGTYEFGSSASWAQAYK